MRTHPPTRAEPRRRPSDRRQTRPDHGHFAEGEEQVSAGVVEVQVRDDDGVDGLAGDGRIEFRPGRSRSISRSAKTSFILSSVCCGVRPDQDAALASRGRCADSVEQQAVVLNGEAPAVVGGDGRLQTTRG